MSRATITAGPQQPGPEPGPTSYEALIEERLGRTRRQVKAVDVASGLILLLIGTLLYLLAAAVIDHWVVSRGLGFWGRLLLLAGLVVGAGWYFMGRVLVPLLGRISPIFAAYTIEQSRPSLKNSLLNFLLLRGHRREVAEPVYEALAHRAASDLSQIEIETAVDRTRVIRRGCVLVGTLAVCALYLVLSPKDPLASAGRVLWPWSDVAAPTRVTIEAVKPGDTAVFHGDFLTVSAEVDGVDQGEMVALCYSTADGQSVDQKVPMTRPEGGYRQQYECRIPPEDDGFQQDVHYYLTAGDSATRQFMIDVQIAPMIVVDRIEYEYPAYTGFSARIVEREGDIRAIEGTRVTIRATANRQIEWSGIDLGCTGRRELDMRAEGMTAAGGFVLRLSPVDPSLPEYDSYQLRFRDEAGWLNPRPARHRIEVVRDLPPEIELVSPEENEIQLALSGRLEIRVRAQDPDFALGRVVLRAESGGRDVVIPPMLQQEYRGEFERGYWFEPARVELNSDSFDLAAGGLKPGDRVRYWAEAEDNKAPLPGLAISEQKWITIVEPPGQEPGAEDAAGGPRGAAGGQSDERNGAEGPQGEAGDQPGGEASEGQQAGPQPSQGDSGAAQERQGAAPGEGEPPAEADGQQGQPDSPAAGGDRQGASAGQPVETEEPIDPETQPGDAFEEILKHLEQQRQEGEGTADDGQAGDEPTDGRPTDEGQGGSGWPEGQESGEGQEDEVEGGEERLGGGSDGRPGGEQEDQGEQAGEGDESMAEGGESQESQGERQDGGEPETAGQTDGQREPAGVGEPEDQEQGSPAPQGLNRPREREAAGEVPEGHQEPAESPSVSRHQSDSQGGTSGDRSGGGQRGGGQQSQQPGLGADGSHTETDEGGSAGRERGDGETGTQGGDQVESDERTGSSDGRRGDGGSNGRGQPNAGGEGEGPREQDRAPSGATPQGDTGEGADGPSSSGAGQQGEGTPVLGGGRPGDQADGTSGGDDGEPGGEDPNLEYAREAVDLALEHLRDQMGQEDSELLKKLGWTAEEAREFADRWEQMRGAAGRGPGDRQGEFDRALQSLGLQPQGTRLEGGGGEADSMGGLRESGRFDAPGDWSELLRAYTRGIAGADGE